MTSIPFSQIGFSLGIEFLKSLIALLMVLFFVFLSKSQKFKVIISQKIKEPIKENIVEIYDSIFQMFLTIPLKIS